MGWNDGLSRYGLRRQMAYVAREDSVTDFGP